MDREVPSSGKVQISSDSNRCRLAIKSLYVDLGWSNLFGVPSKRFSAFFYMSIFQKNQVSSEKWHLWSRFPRIFTVNNEDLFLINNEAKRILAAFYLGQMIQILTIQHFCLIMKMFPIKKSQEMSNSINNLLENELVDMLICEDENVFLNDEEGNIIPTGGEIQWKVDNYAPKVKTYPIDKKADAQFNQLESIYVGRNETMGTGDGFIGCISKVQFEDHFPLRRAFQEGRRGNLYLHPETVREDNCGIEPVTYPPERSETRPPPTLPPGVFLEAVRAESEDAAILGGVLVIIFLALILMAILIGRYMSRHKGEYRTHEDTGAKDAPDADTAVIQSKTGHGVPKKKEWFI
ncbi:neurexin-4-like [Centruroides sculpturatus]|uniref:neurexin-4-like n=1 Tax=Centruroides sculpturatus TaxID=218467 RepID=UPI000C6EFE5B|nr:neurexin-4-like [Centruroides sculpturatus]